MADAVEADVTCPVCLEIFREPVQLRCLHTLCKECSSLPSMKLNTGGDVQCPTCRHITKKSEIKHDFKTQNWVQLYLRLKQGVEQQGARSGVGISTPNTTTTASTGFSPGSTVVPTPSAPQMEHVSRSSGFEHSSDNTEQSQTPYPIGTSANYAAASSQGAVGGNYADSTQTGSGSKHHMTSKEREALGGANATVCTEEEEEFLVVPMPRHTQSLYPSLDPPPAYSQVVAPPEDPLDDSSLKHFIGTELYPEEVFKFRGKVLMMRKIHNKLWCVMYDGTIKVFQKTGYQFGKYISSDIQVFQHGSPLWSLVPWQSGSPGKYVYKVTAVTEAYNGNIFACCKAAVTPLSFADNTGLVQINNIGQVLTTIGYKQYSIICSHGKLIYALYNGKNGTRIDTFQQEKEGNKWIPHRKIAIAPGATKIAIGHDLLYVNVVKAPMSHSLLVYDLHGKSATKRNKYEYENDVVDIAGIQPNLCSVDPHGNVMVSDASSGRLLLLDRLKRRNDILIRGQGQMKLIDIAMETAKTFLGLAEGANGIWRLIHFSKPC